MCDVRRLDAISLAADRRSVTVGAGVLAIDLITALAAHGLAVPTGSCPTVGISGLALGGGVGFAARAYRRHLRQHPGRARSSPPTAASGTADRGDEPRPPVGLPRRRRGNFGAVTALTLATHPVSTARLRLLRLPLVAGGRGARRLAAGRARTGPTACT